MLVIMFSTFRKTNFKFSVTFILSPANALNLDKSRSLLLGNELKVNQSLRVEKMLAGGGAEKEKMQVFSIFFFFPAMFSNCFFHMDIKSSLCGKGLSSMKQY